MANIVHTPDSFIIKRSPSTVEINMRFTVKTIHYSVNSITIYGRKFNYGGNGWFYDSERTSPEELDARFAEFARKYYLNEEMVCISDSHKVTIADWKRRPILESNQMMDGRTVLTEDGKRLCVRIQLPADAVPEDDKTLGYVNIRHIRRTSVAQQ